MKKIVIIGAGSMGSAFTLPCIDNRNRTFLVGTHLEDKLINNLKKNYLHPLLKTKLPKKLTIEKLSVDRIAKKTMKDQAYATNPKKAPFEDMKEMVLQSIKKAR